MGRPIKQNAVYFCHNNNFRNEITIKALRSKFGNEGYGILICVFEYMCAQDSFIIEDSELEIELLSSDFNCSPEILKEIIVYGTRIGVFKKDNNTINSPLLMKILFPLLENRERERLRKARQKSIPPENTGKTQENTGKTPENTGKTTENVDNTELITTDGIAYLLDDKKWLEAASGSLGISIFETKEWLKDLSKEWELKGQTIHKDLADIKSHFINQMEKKKQKGVSLKISTVKKWQFCMDSLSKNLSLEEKKVIETIKLEEVDNTNTKISLSSANQQQAKELIKKYLDNINELTRIAFGKVFKFFIAT